MIRAWQRFRHKRTRRASLDASPNAQSILDLSRSLRPLNTKSLQDAFLDLRGQVEKSGFDHKATAVAKAFVVEAARRSLDIEYYIVQIQAGQTLNGGAIAEMKTGEGKTLAAAFPGVLWSMHRHGVHVMTANDYLARRDEEYLRPLYQTLGLKTSVLSSDRQASAAAYDADITYGSGDRFAFDYLFEQLQASADPFSRPKRRAFAVIDEADSVMIDEASSPLIVSIQPQEPHPVPEPYIIAQQVAAELEQHQHFSISPTSQIMLKPAAHDLIEKARRVMVVNNFRLQRPWESYVLQAIVARQFFVRDIHYVEKDYEILFVDQHTGRIFPERTWRDGLHQAIQAKEKAVVTTETRSAARITRQRFFNLYETKCGMTGTAFASHGEFHDVYGLRVVRVPLRTPCLRVEFSTRYFGSDDAKWQAITENVLQRHARSQPILVGTATISASEKLADRIQQAGASCQVLNGKQDEEEAVIIERAGQAGTITIATNMAGRGADIRIDSAAQHAGGLHVIAAQRHSSSRIDRQLVGRCARQGAPGSCQFFVSADDELIVAHGGILMRRMKRLAPDGEEIQRNLDPAIRDIQRRAEQVATNRRQSLAQRDEQRMDLIERL